MRGAMGEDSMRRAGDLPHTAIRVLLLLAILFVSGCTMIGPDYAKPMLPLAAGWIPRDAAGIAPSTEPIGPWWESFGDPVLTNLIVEAYRRNPSLQAAGVRVLEAQARRGIAIGTLFPQMQNAVGGYRRSVASENVVAVPPERSFNEFLAGFDVGWELDKRAARNRPVRKADRVARRGVPRASGTRRGIAPTTAYGGCRTLSTRMKRCRVPCSPLRSRSKVHRRIVGESSYASTGVPG